MVYEVENFDVFTFMSKIKIAKRKRGNQGGKKESILDIIAAFDIETTALLDIEQSIMYIWQFQLGPETTVYGRTWESFRAFIDNVEACILDDTKMIVFVHNLSYEFQFLRNVWEWEPDDVFAVKSRKVLYARHGKIEFRCSYLQTNMSLAEFTEKMKVKHQKLSGEEFDYDKQRYPWTPLTERELEYCFNDVIGLVEAIQVEMEADGDNLYTLPFTSTGYVRRDAKAAMRKTPRGYVDGLLPDLDTYLALKEAFRGGNTHANRYYVGDIIKNVKSADRSSSYPDIQCNMKFPVSAFYHSGHISPEELDDLIYRREKAVLFRAAFKGLRLRNVRWGCPYISKSKCRNIVDGRFDNGRILDCEYMETTITDVDYTIIKSEYEWDGIYVADSWHARYGKLPQALINCTIDYYIKKTSLKDVDGQEVFYTKAKNKLNAVYGCSAQDPAKVRLIFDPQSPELFRAKLSDETMKEPTRADIEELLKEYRKRAVMPYQWGVWITAWARYRLEEGIQKAQELEEKGKGFFIYCDTDSVKYCGDIDWGPYNAQLRADSLESGAWADDPKGERHFMGVYEADGLYLEFKTLGAKKYAYVETNKKTGEPELHITIAGVGKKKGAKELKRAGGLKAMEPCFTFTEGGGTESVYNDRAYGYYEIDGRQVFIGPNLYIKPSTYTLSLTAEYYQLLKSCKNFS